MATPLERDLATVLVPRLAGQIVCFEGALDTGASNRPNPDVAFSDSRAQRYVVEVTRLMPPRLMEVYSFARRSISEVLEPLLGGTYILSFRFDRLGPDHRIPPNFAAAIVAAVEGELARGELPSPFHPSPDYELRKVDADGRRIEPWVLMKDLPFDASPADPEAVALQGQLERAVEEADRKLAGHRGRRILLVHLGHVGIDAEFHSGRFAGSVSLLDGWATQLSGRFPNVEEIYLDPGVSVWTEPWIAVRSEHRHSYSPRGFHIRLRPHPVTWI
jgi:hypothetical protein